MGWIDIKDRIEVPSMSDDGIKQIIGKLIKNEIVRSRSLELDDYIEPKEGNYDKMKEFLEINKYEIIRYLAQSLLRDCSNNPNDLVSNYIPGWKEKNPEIDITIGELQKISSMSDFDIQNRKNSKSVDNNIIRFIKKTYDSCCDFDREHNGDNPIYPFELPDKNEKSSASFINNFPYSKRIYMNRNKNNIMSWMFIFEYIKKCIDNRIQFQMKAEGGGLSDIDNLILYGHNKDFDKKIDIVEEIIKNNPEIMEQFGSPICTAGNVIEENGKSYFAVSFGHGTGLRKNVDGKYKMIPTGKTYNDYATKIIEISYLFSCIEFMKDSYKGGAFLLQDVVNRFDDETKVLFNKLYHLSMDSLSKFDLQNISSNANYKNIVSVISKIVNDEKDEEIKNDYIDILLQKYKKIFSKICSLERFNSLEYTDVSIYMDEGFMEFDKQMEETIKIK